MSTKFMSDTSLANLETEMQLVPGFRPRKNGFVISRVSCSSTNCKCQYCTSHRGKQKECFVAEYRGISDLLDKLSAEVGVPPFVSRISRLLGDKQFFFMSSRHQQRFDGKWRGHLSMADEAAWCAALYLLSSDMYLWNKAEAAIKPDMIDFTKICIHGVDLDGYVLFHTAQDLYKGTKHISLSELTDPELVSDQAFRFIIGGYLIRRYGPFIILKEEGVKEA